MQYEFDNILVKLYESASGQRPSEGVMSENNMMCKIAHFCTFLCAILTNSVRNFYLLTKYIILDAKIAWK